MTAPDCLCVCVCIFTAQTTKTGQNKTEDLSEQRALVVSPTIVPIEPGQGGFERINLVPFLLCRTTHRDKTALLNVLFWGFFCRKVHAEIKHT